MIIIQQIQLLTGLKTLVTSEFTTGTDVTAKRHGYVLGTVTLSSIKNFTVAGDHANPSYLVENLTGQTASGGTKLTASNDQEHATDLVWLENRPAKS